MIIWNQKYKTFTKACFLFFLTHLSLSLFSFSLSFGVQLPWKWTINLFPKGIPHATQAWQPQYDGCCVVNKQFSWASLPFKGTFSSSPDHVKNVVVKGSLLFFSHKDVRWRELEFPNMLIRVSVNSAPSSTVLESSFSMLEISCAWATQVCLWVRMQYVFKL